MGQYNTMARYPFHSKIAPQWSPRTLGVETPTGRTAHLQIPRDFAKLHSFIENSQAQKKLRKFGQKLIFLISLQNQLLVNGMSYCEIKTQLLIFRKGILAYELAYHLIFFNRNENGKGDRGDWGVVLWR